MASSVHADELHVSRASERSWSGGPPGRAGTTYGITVVSGYPVSKLRIAGLWVGEVYVAVGTSSPHTLEVSHQAKAGSVEYQLRCEIDHSVGVARRDEPEDRTARTKRRPPGTAKVILDVYVDGRERFLPVTALAVL